jgi:ABC-type antimicrobial peptide transport system permease subunit
MTVVGVVGDVRASRMAAKFSATFYMPIAQEPDSSLALVVRTTIPPQQLAEPMRKMVLGLDPDLPVFGVQTMTQVVAASIASERVATILVTGFASLAVMLALMGIYSVVSYSVVSRTRDIGIRMALGAQASDVLSLLMRQTLALVGIGMAIGIAGAYGISQALASLLQATRRRLAIVGDSMPSQKVGPLEQATSCRCPRRSTLWDGFTAQPQNSSWSPAAPRRSRSASAAEPSAVGVPALVSAREQRSA